MAVRAHKKKAFQKKLRATINSNDGKPCCYVLQQSKDAPTEKRIGEEEVMGKVLVQRENMKTDMRKYRNIQRYPPVSPTRGTACRSPLTVAYV